MPGLAGFAATSILVVVAALIAVPAFLHVRTRWPRVYAPRALKFPGQLPTLSDGLVAFIPQLWSLSDDQVFQCAGLNAVMLMKFFHLCTNVLGFALLYAVIVLLPIHTIVVAHQSYEVDPDFDHLKTSLIPTHSGYFWAHVAGIYAITAFTLWQVRKTYHAYLRYRFIYWLHRSDRHGGVAMLATALPACMTASSVALTGAFRQLYGKAVVGAQVIYDTTTLEEIFSRYEATFHRLQLAELRRERARELERELGSAGGCSCAQCKAGCADCCASSLCMCCMRTRAYDLDPTRSTGLCTSEPLIPYLRRELERLRLLLLNEQQLVKYRPSESGIVYFSSVNTALLASSVPNVRGSDIFRVTPAPESADIAWNSFNRTEAAKSVTTVMAWTVLAFVAIFFTAASTFVGSLLSIKRLGDDWAWVRMFTQDNPVLTGLLEGVIPSLVLVLLQALARYLLLRLSMWQGLNSYCEVQRSVADKYFMLMFVAFFLGVLLSGAIWSSLGDAWDNPSMIPHLLADRLPDTSSFFVSFILMSCLVPLTYLLDYTRFGLVKLAELTAQTDRDKARAYDLNRCRYGFHYPEFVYILTLALSFAVLAPMILPVAVVYAVLAHQVFKYKIIYMYAYDHGQGTFWPAISGKIFISLFFMQLLFFSFLQLREMHWLSLALLPCMAATLLVYVLFNRWFGASEPSGYGAEFCSLREAVQIDQHLRHVYRQQRRAPEFLRALTVRRAGGSSSDVSDGSPRSGPIRASGDKSRGFAPHSEAPRHKRHARRTRSKAKTGHDADQDTPVETKRETADVWATDEEVFAARVRAIIAGEDAKDTDALVSPSSASDSVGLRDFLPPQISSGRLNIDEQSPLLRGMGAVTVYTRGDAPATSSLHGNAGVYNGDAHNEFVGSFDAQPTSHSPCYTQGGGQDQCPGVRPILLARHVQFDLTVRASTADREVHGGDKPSSSASPERGSSVVNSGSGMVDLDATGGGAQEWISSPVELARRDRTRHFAPHTLPFAVASQMSAPPLANAVVDRDDLLGVWLSVRLGYVPLAAMVSPLPLQDDESSLSNFNRGARTDASESRIGAGGDGKEADWGDAV